MVRPSKPPSGLHRAASMGLLSACLLLTFPGCEGEIGSQSGDGRIGTGSGVGGSSGQGSGSSQGLPDPDPERFPGGGPVPRGLSLEGSPVYTRFARLTNVQWNNAVTEILGLSGDEDLSSEFEQPVLGATDFDNNEHVLTMTSGLWDAYQAASERAATLATATSSAMSRVYSGSDAAGFVKALGRRAFRRPLTGPEQSRYQALFTRGQALPGAGSPFQKGAGLVIRAMLQSPHFLYRSELGSFGSALSGYELAAKLSFWLLRTTPSEELLDIAERGGLDSEAGLVEVASEMLEQPEAAQTMREFYGQLFDFDRYRTISKIGVSDYDEALNGELEESSYLFFERIFREGLGLTDILTGTTGFVGPRMAELYGVEPPRFGFEERELGSQRVGYFAQLPFLTLNAFNDEPDSIHRGVALNLDVLCADPGTAAPNLPPVPALQPGQTNRQRISTLTSGCGGECHNSYINPLGFAFESFDGLGRLRDRDNGQAVDTAASYPFLEGIGAYENAGDLMQLMAEGLQAHACHAKKIASYALGRDIVESDEPLLRTLADVGLAGGSLKEVMLALVKHPAFRTRAGEPR